MNFRLIVVSLLALSLMACGSKQETQTAKVNDPNIVELPAEMAKGITVMKVGDAEIRDLLRIPGSIQVDEQRMARIGAPVTGRISDIDVVLGQHVKRGQVLATVNSTELAQNQLAYIKALQQISLQSKAVDRAKALLDADVIAPAELQKRESELSGAKADLIAARNQLMVLGMSQANIDKLSRSAQMDTFSNINARIAGTVISRKINLGQVVQPADELFVVADLSTVWAVAEVPEHQIDLIEKGQEVDIEIPAIYEKPIKGKLIFVGDVVNPETRTVTVRSEILNNKQEIKPDMLVSMLVLSKPTKKLSVPAQAIVRENDKNYVFVQIAPNKYRLREVTTDEEYQGNVAVINGLSAGETIIVEGAFHVNNERKRKELE
ncbi:MAG: efflux RND transporter periplasmic adaptor subunit [Candidatus Methylopumilus sp.]|jgi:cobalt-zinc-cadmium efflux system membrane fusion protein|nr:efflux RND transporter periplasmic adaptor subunit [Candidatus Methylopumilus sp.]NBW60840.1 efflux RND transporter periplasmic adaptor subunit [Methylophilaceae bacterium]